MARIEAKNVMGEDQISLLSILEARFSKNMQRHKGIDWNDVMKKLDKNFKVLKSLQQMEDSGGEPDVVDVDEKNKRIYFFDCSAETPKGRRSLCYDRAGLLARKDFPPANTAVDMAADAGIKLMTEDQYHKLQSTGKFDLKTSSWLLTPVDVRNNGGAIFGDCRYGRVFIYHNGAQSYYGSRGFRSVLEI